MGFLNDSIIDFRKIGLRIAQSSLEQYISYGKGELFVLNYLYFKRDVAQPSELSKALGSSTARISAILKTLEKKGEIARDVDKSNCQNVLVSITDAGCARAERIVAALDKTMASVFVEMGEEETHEFLHLMNRFLDALAKHPIEETHESLEKEDKDNERRR
jgi:DNA-binding MarR family transcriptional regulator